jgi:chemotaxis protein MotB
MKSNLLKTVLAAFLIIALGGCTFIFQSGRRSDVVKIEKLSQQLDDLIQTKKLLEERLSREIQDKEVGLKMVEKGLMITFLADIIFDSGKASIRPEAYSVLDKVARVLQENVPDLKIGIEGHTDNVPIKLSKWKSNWQLSSERALSVLYYLVDKKGISPDRVSAIGNGEFQPVSSNDTKEGRRLNRRVEIVIMPKIAKAKDSKSPLAKPGLKESEDNLK